MKVECLFYQVNVCLSGVVDDDSEVSGCDIVELYTVIIIISTQRRYPDLNGGRLSEQRSRQPRSEGLEEPYFSLVVTPNALLSGP